MTSTPQLPVWQVLAADLGKREPPGVRRITGDHFCIEFVRIGAAMTVDRIADAAAGEEVAAVLEGNVRVRSGAEEYELSRGEGIIIPPGQGSSWSSQGASALLYRVIVHAATAHAEPEVGR
jgi:mannose-6-phosphate isomerase-like protein (cupin superfamily)